VNWFYYSHSMMAAALRVYKTDDRRGEAQKNGKRGVVTRVVQ